MRQKNHWHPELCRVEGCRFEVFSAANNTRYPDSDDSDYYGWLKLFWEDMAHEVGVEDLRPSVSAAAAAAASSGQTATTTLTAPAPGSAAPAPGSAKPVKVEQGNGDNKKQ